MKNQLLMQRMRSFGISVNQKSFCGWAPPPDPLREFTALPQTT